jgi:hypothetical protein
MQSNEARPQEGLSEVGHVPLARFLVKPLPESPVLGPDSGVAVLVKPLPESPF